MSANIIVCVTTQRAIAAVFHHGRLGPCHDFAIGEEGQRAFGDLLHEHPGLPVYLMVDSVEEDYHADVLPHVSGAARQELVLRKLRQLYRSSSYYTAWVQGRETDKRRDDRYLFAALTNTDLLRPWLDTLHAFRAALAGVYLLPMVSQELVARLSLRESDLLLVTRHNGGLRQSFFQGGQLKASRLALADLEQASSTEHLAIEIGKTRLYLNSLRLTTREAKLTVLLLDTDDGMAELQQRLQADTSYICHRLTRDELSARLGGAPLKCPYALHMTVLGLQQPANNLAPASATRHFWHYQQRRLLYGASLAVMTAAVIWTGGNLFQRYQLNDEVRRLEAQTQEQQTRYVEVTKTFPQAPASADNLEKAVQLAARIRQDSRTPEAIMLAVSRALQTSPEITLTRLSWKFGAGSHDAGLSPGANVPPPATPGNQLESGVVEGEIRPFHGDYRAAMASVNRLAEKMRHDPGVASVNVIQTPLNIQSTTALSGNTLNAASSDAARAEFKLKVVLKERT